MAQHADPLEMLQRFVAGDTAPDVLRHFQAAFGGYLRAEGKVPLERCLHLPTTPVRLRLAQRDVWLLRAAELIEETTAYSTAQAVAKELDTFITCGPWRLWRDRHEPPAGAIPLRAALFFVARFNGGRGLSAKQVARVIGHRFNKQCPSMPSRLHTTSTHIDAYASPRIPQRSQQA